MTFLYHQVGGVDAAGFATTSAGALLLAMKELWKRAGWVHRASYDGTNLSNTLGNENDQITTADEMQTVGAWFVMQSPSGRQVCFRRGSLGDILIVHAPPNVDGTAQAFTAVGTAATIPTWATQFAVVGSLPNTTAGWLNVTTVSRALLIADDETDTVLLATWYPAPSGTAPPRTEGTLFIDSVITDDPDDPDPVVIGATGSTGQGLEMSNLGTAGNPSQTGGLGVPCGWTRRGKADQVYGHIPARTMSNLIGSANMRYVGRSGLDLVHRSAPIIWARTAATTPTQWPGTGAKGRSRLFTMQMCSFLTPTLLKRDGVPRSAVVLDDFIVPWPGTVLS